MWQLKILHYLKQNDMMETYRNFVWKTENTNFPIMKDTS